MRDYNKWGVMLQTEKSRKASRKKSTFELRPKRELRAHLETVQEKAEETALRKT